MAGHVERELSPGDQFIDEALGGLTQMPPAGLAASDALAQHVWRPLLLFDNGREDLVRREVTEVQIRRERAGAIDFGFVAGRGVVLQFPGDEELQTLLCNVTASTHLCRRNGVIDLQRCHGPGFNGE